MGPERRGRGGGDVISVRAKEKGYEEAEKPKGDRWREGRAGEGREDRGPNVGREREKEGWKGEKEIARGEEREIARELGRKIDRSQIVC